MGDLTARATQARDARCGSTNGYSRHKALDEKPCDACATARSEYDERLRSVGGRAQKSRLRARAQSAAMTRLRKQYPDEAQSLYQEELARLRSEEGVE